MSINSVSQVPNARPLGRPEVDNEVSGSTRIALDVILPVSTGIVADKVLKSAAKGGSLTAFALSLVASAVTHSVTEGGVQVVKNFVDGQPWDNRLKNRLLMGAQGGVFIGVSNAVGPWVQKGLLKHYPTLSPVLAVGLANATTGSIGSAIRVAADTSTWKNGVSGGLTQIGITAGINAVGALAIGSGIKTAQRIPAVNQVFQKLPYPFNG